MSRGPAFTPEEDALIERPARPLTVIAAEIGRSVDAIYNRRRDKGWATNPPPPPHRVAMCTPDGKRVYPQPSFRNRHFVKPEMEAREEPTLRRACLSCRMPFSTTRFVYVCGPCKKSTNWDCAV